MKRYTAALLAAAVFAARFAWADPGVTPNRILLGQAAVFSGPAAQLGIQKRGKQIVVPITAR